MKILFFGLGSIGKRHLDLLRKRGGDFTFLAYRSGTNAKKFENVDEYYDLDKALEKNPDVVFITNPSNLHIEYSIKCAEKNCHLFIEKPLSNNLNDIDRLKKLVEEKNLFNYVGFNLRFHPVLERIKEIIVKENVIYTDTINTSYLPDWRTGQDYRKSFSADSERGGGILLELIHELDYNYWLFGDIKCIKGRYGKISNLEIESEDFGDLMLEHENGIISKIHLNWFTKHNERKIKIYCHDKYIEGDLIKNKLKIEYDNGQIEEIKYDIDRDYSYEKQLDYFFDKYKKNEKPMNDIAEATKVLEYLIDFKNNNQLIREW
jgi:predicted dehydrogenase